jgi:hypothetical protein
MASKWVANEQVRNAFDQKLYKLDTQQSDVRFLILNPHSRGFERLYDLRNGKLDSASVAPLRELCWKHESLQVRCFDQLPTFRIVIIDDDIVSFSPYRLASDAYRTTDSGWNAPHVVLDPLAEYPLAEAFEQLFAQTWAVAKPIEEV